MFYLFIHSEKDLAKYKQELDRVIKNIELGKTPVCNEVRMAKTMLAEAIPYQTITGIFLVVGTLLLNKLDMSELSKIAVVLIVNNLCCALANYIFVQIKHCLRLALCKRLNIAATERVIAAMESLEYQSV